MADALLTTVLVVYLILLAGVAMVANQHKRKTAEESGAAASHFGGSFSTVELTITTASSIFSGATVVGIPAEAARLGYIAVRWFLAMAAIVASMTLLYPRLRRRAGSRGYLSPNDFVFDHFKSQPLRILTALASAVSGIIYLTIQFNAFGNQIKSASGDTVPLWRGMTVFGVLVIVMEMVGGLSSVVFTDVVQGCIMLACFIVIPFVLFADFGNFLEMAPAGCGNGQNRTSGGFVSEQCMAGTEGCIFVGCVGDSHPKFLEYPTREVAISDVFWFVFGMLAYPLNLQMLQRCYIAKSEAGLKIVMFSLLGAAVIAYVPGIYMGVAHTAFKATFPEKLQKAPVFFAMMEELRAQGGFRKLLMSVYTCSYLAAVMSTADSVVMGISATVSQDIVKGVLLPDMDQEKVVHVGLGVSLLQVVFGVAGGRFIGPPEYGATLSLANGFLFQVMPSYLLGLFTSIPALPVLCGIASGLLVATGLSFSAPLGPWLPAPFAGLLVNFAVVAAVWLVLWLAASKGGKKKNRVATADGSLLELAEGSRLPSAVLPWLAFGICVLTTPIWQKAGSEQPVFGMPAHAWVMFIGALLASGVNCASLALWSPLRDMGSHGGRSDSESGSTCGSGSDSGSDSESRS